IAVAVTPPRLACALLRWLLPPDDFEAISGDLEESLNAIAIAPSNRSGRVWYWRQVVSILNHRLVAATHDLTTGRPKGRIRMGFRHDLSYSVRSLMKAPLFAVTTIVMLAIGIGANVAMFSLVKDVRYGSVETSVMPDVYLPLLQSMRSGGFIFVKSRLPEAVLVPIVRQEVSALDRDVPLIDIKMMDERFEDATWRTRICAWLLAAFAALAL